MLNDTQIPASRVAIADNAEPTRPWFRFFSNLYDFIGLGNGVVPETSGGTGNTAYATGDLLYASAPNTLSRLPVPGSPCYLGTDATNMPQWIPVAYGSFSNTTTQTAPAGTPTGIVFDVTDYARNISLSGSKFTLAKTGLYNIIFSLQLSNSNTSSDDDAVVWLRVNGANIANTASKITVVKSHGGVAGNAILTVNFMYQFTAGDYFEIYGLSLLGYIALQTYPASTSPAYPVSPAAILTVAQIV